MISLSKLLTPLCAFALLSSAAQAGDIRVRAGYNLGGIAPMSLPAEIRKINSYNPGFGFMIGADYHRTFNEQWGYSIGLRLDNVRMRTNATVKNYHTRITREGETIEGNFTGRVKTHASVFYMKLPVLAEWQPSPKWTVKAGPYLSLNADGKFKGDVYDGYLRRGNPTGERIDIQEEGQASYDFSQELATFGGGVIFGADYYITPKVGIFGEVDWGFSRAFRTSFKTISFTMYPVHGTLGVVYKF